MWEALLEFLFQLVLELLSGLPLDAGWWSSGREAGRLPSPWASAMGWGVLGLIVGGVSLFVFPGAWISSRSFRILNLLFTPLLAGSGVALMGAWYGGSGRCWCKPIHFWRGLFFMAALLLVRFLFAV